MEPSATYINVVKLEVPDHPAGKGYRDHVRMFASTLLSTKGTQGT